MGKGKAKQVEGREDDDEPEDEYLPPEDEVASTDDEQDEGNNDLKAATLAWDEVEIITADGDIKVYKNPNAAKTEEEHVAEVFENVTNDPRSEVNAMKSKARFTMISSRFERIQADDTELDMTERYKMPSTETKYLLSKGRVDWVECKRGAFIKPDPGRDSYKELSEADLLKNYGQDYDKEKCFCELCKRRARNSKRLDRLVRADEPRTTRSGASGNAAYFVGKYGAGHTL